MSLPFDPANPTQPTLSIISVISDETIDTYTTSNYVSNISNILDTKINTKQNTLTASTTLLGIGSSITNIEYANVINKPSTFPANMTNIYTKGETDSLVNAKQATLTAATTLLGTGGSITGINFNTVINKPTYTSPLASNVSTNVISVDLSSKQNTLTAATTLLGTGGSITGINFNTITNKPTYTAPLSSNLLTNVISVDLSSYATNTALTNGLAAKQDTLTAATTLLGTGGSITGINFNTITNKPTYTSPLSSNVSTNVISVDLSSKQNTLTASTTLLGIGSNLTLINYSNLSNLPSTFNPDLTNIYTKTEILNINTLSNYYTKSQTEGLAILTNFYNKNDSDGRFLRLTGGNLTGVLNLTGLPSGNNPLYISSTNTTANNCIHLKNNSTFSAYIGIGGTNIGGNYANNLFLESASSSIILNTNGRVSGSTPNMIIHSSGNVGIGTTDPKTLLHVNGKTLIHNAVAVAPANGIYGNDGTRIILWPGAADNVAYSLGIAGGTLWYAVPTGAIHAFYVGTTERLRINTDGNVGIGTNPSQKLHVNGNIDCEGGIAIAGSQAFYSDVAVNTGNKSNTYINFKFAGTNNDWCYLRQIGGENAYKLAFDFHDDGNDARFCIRNIHSAGQDPDIITEVFTIDNGNTTINGNLTANQYFVNGNTYSFNANWNGTGSSGWFIPMNPYWSSGHTCLNVSIYAMNLGGSNAFCWFGRVYLSTSGNGTSPATNGGIIQIITDYRNPTVNSTNNNYMIVDEKWDGSGNNTLWIQINSFTFAGNIKVKIYG